jgi:hypothetical protein
MRGPIYYIAGPPDMVAATIRTLGNAGVMKTTSGPRCLRATEVRLPECGEGLMAL